MKNDMDRMKEMDKPTLLSIRQQTSITTQQLAHEAGVSLTEAYVVEIGGFVDVEIAEKVVVAFSQLSGKSYTLNDIRLQNVSKPTVLGTKRPDSSTIKYTSSRQKL